jgi:hypothetical protein
MQLNDFFIKIILIFLPGVLTTLIIRSLLTNKTIPNFYFVIYSFVYGVSIYAILELFLTIIQCIIYLLFRKYYPFIIDDLTIWDYLFGVKPVFNKNELIFATLMTIPYSYVLGSLFHKRVIARIFRKFNMSARDGEDDVWDGIFEHDGFEIVVVRDFKHNLAYYGIVQEYSESFDKREILLEDVEVYEQENWKYRYSLNKVYLELEDYNYTIEVQLKKSNKTNEKHRKDSDREDS